MKFVVLLLLLAIAVTLVASHPSGNKLATLTSVKPKENIMIEDDFKKVKRHVSRCKTKVHSSSFSLQTRLGNVAFAQSSASTRGSLHRHHLHSLVHGINC